jgi:hypothetical protein
VTARFFGWWRTRSAREQRLLRLAVVACGTVAALRLGTAVVRDLAQVRARLEGQERDLVSVRRLARELAQHRTAVAAKDDRPLVTRIEAAATAVVGHERIASMTPMVGAADGVALRLVDASLGDTVRLLYDVEHGGDRVDKLDLVKHPDDPSRFDVTLEIAGDPAP